MTIKVTKIETNRYIFDVTAYVRKKDNNVKLEVYQKEDGKCVMKDAMIINGEIYYNYLIYDEQRKYSDSQYFLEEVKQIIRSTLRWIEYWDDIEAILKQ